MNMHSRLTISGTYLLIVALGLAISWHIFNTADKIYASTDDLVNRKIPTVRTIEGMRASVSEYERVLYEYYATTDQQQAHLDLEPVIVRFEHNIETLNANLNNTGVISIISDQFARMQMLAVNLDDNLGNRGIDWDLAREQLKQISDYGRTINPSLDKLILRSNADAEAGRKSTLSNNQSMKLSVAGYALFVCIITGLVTFFINRYLVAATQRRRAQEKLQHLALHDTKTGLPNRHHLEQHLNYALEDPQSQFAVALIQLDRLQRVSNSYGYNTVDSLLKETVARIKAVLASENHLDCLYRFDGYTLALVINDGDKKTMGQLGGILKQSFDDPLEINDGPFYQSLSIGFSRYPQNGSDATHLIKNADTALSRMVREGGNGTCAYSLDMYISEQAWIELERELEQALENNELTLFYQPKVESTSLKVTGAEALIRWQKQDHSWVAPDAFIPLAEQTGLILQIGEWVIREACLQAKAWRDAGHHDFVVAINISARQFQHHQFVQGLEQILRETNTPARNIELEITESLIMQDISSVIETLTRIKALGISLAIDDFGTGYSSLSYLSQFPIDKLKIDRSFVQNIENSSDNLAIVRTVIDLAHHLGLCVVAEGVETQAQLGLLQQYGCEEIQGYFISKPLPAEKLHCYLQNSLEQSNVS
jgi:diguanylate cyclase (GGDEF)-like protein